MRAPIKPRRKQVKAARTGMAFCGYEVLLAVPSGVRVDPDAIVRIFVEDFQRKVQRASMLNIRDIYEKAAKEMEN